MKKGFTLTELLVVIVIIGILAVLVIPSVGMINGNINKRLLSNKKDNIVKAAELYASDFPDIFEGKAEVKIYVAELIAHDYLKSEKKESLSLDGGVKCVQTIIGDITYSNDGCILDPTNNSKTLNTDYVLVKKKAVGYVGEYGGPDDGTDPADNTKLNVAVCDYFEKGNLIGQAEYNGELYRCFCNYTSTEVNKLYVNVNGSEKDVNACIVSGYTDNNYLWHDDVYYRVLGIYNLGDNGFTVKLITDEGIDVS